MNNETCNCENKKKKSVVIWVIIAVLAIAAIVYKLNGNNGGGEKKTYEAAMAQYNEKNYDEALKTFIEVKDYSDSQEYIDLCNYKLGKAAEKDQKYEEAVKYYSEVSENSKHYKDAQYSMQWNKLQYLVANKDGEHTDLFKQYEEELKADEGFAPAVESMLK